MAPLQRGAAWNAPPRLPRLLFLVYNISNWSGDTNAARQQRTDNGVNEPGRRRHECDSP